ncbi:hypothetical protein [Parabacteroides gordonii]|jgi:response regulator of citrate/malate metabolism|uniref:hypothetical protein n=1 Tax=Parabacteroides gordonii TaxID=574930 RepID=UPI00241F55B1|nr:hypothetical protein [Parabacteroides gordonii]
MIHILLAEDEIALAKIIKDSLESRQEFRITIAATIQKLSPIARPKYYACSAYI